MGISDILCCYGDTVSMATRKILSNFVVLGAVKFILGMEIPWGSGDQSWGISDILCYYGDSYDGKKRDIEQLLLSRGL